MLGWFKERRVLTLGLTPLGVDAVAKMLELGMLVDVTHCTPVARRQDYDIVERRSPILATHVGTYTVNPNPYNLTDHEARRIATGGGLIGMIFINYQLTPYGRKRGMDIVVQTIRHFVDVVGVEHVGFGSDFDDFTDPPVDLKDASEMPYLTRPLLADGFGETEVHKLLGGNALRVLREEWGKQE